jgi:hypothetical protein
MLGSPLWEEIRSDKIIASTPPNLHLINYILFLTKEPPFSVFNISIDPLLNNPDGGMGFYRLFKNYYPDVTVCYFSDAGAVPYGRQQKAQLKKRLYSIVTFLKDRQIIYLVIACNAMSTVLPFWTPPDGFNFYWCNSADACGYRRASRANGGGSRGTPH